MAVATNADEYANSRINIFFPGVIPELDGQCVSLVKWFLQEMTGVPNPQAARGDARYVGKTLVAQGHAVEVPYSERRRGDLICYEYGTYGHIGVVLSADRTFEENVNWSGVSSKMVDGAKVYASRIGNLSEGWRHDQHIYRVNTYNEGGNMRRPIDPKLVREHYINYTGYDPGVGSTALNNRFEDPEDDEFWYGLAAHINNVRRGLVQNVADLTQHNVELTGEKAQLAGQNSDLQKQVTDLRAQLADPDKIIITKKGFAAVWEALKSFFNKNN